MVNCSMSMTIILSPKMVTCSMSIKQRVHTYFLNKPHVYIFYKPVPGYQPVLQTAQISKSGFLNDKSIALTSQQKT